MNVTNLVFSMASISRVKWLVRESNAGPEYVERITEVLDDIFNDLNFSVDEVQGLLRVLRQIEKEGATEPGTLAYSMSKLAGAALRGEV